MTSEQATEIPAEPAWRDTNRARCRAAQRAYREVARAHPEAFREALARHLATEGLQPAR